MLSSAEIEAMRVEVGDLLPDTAAIYRRTASTDGVGAPTYAWTMAGETACRITSRGVPQHVIEAAQEMNASAWLVTVPADAGIYAGDRLVIGGRTLAVLGDLAVGAWATARRLACVEVA